MRRTRRAVAHAFAPTGIRCPDCPEQLHYYGKPDWVAFMRDGKPVRLWCPKCDQKYDVNVKSGPTAEEDERTLTRIL